ncbi:competence/damage-inducible protein A [Paraconexibacter antarcticus]|uniref:CinA-like protein n=1 Tax=Paraconexibacter antarcticus TaxID=2949664 RepID=A0ABY5DPR9_9ACTN|nr:competence/damage-inducible protein A [Paraconexibacter antarcticus]UTI62777.1 competence/damage-inducible protein A [Paraconexibacter antarcticus]
MAARAGIVVTGTEVLTGRVADRNGPWVVEQLRELGVDVAHIAVVGDRSADMTAALGFFASEGMDLIVTSGGLGPTADDLTAEVVGAFQGRPMVLDEVLQERIAEILRPMVARWKGLDMDALEAGTRKQAVIPEGATILDPVGTAPGLLVTPADEAAGPTVLVLPGPPRELQPMWAAAVQTEAFAAATAGRTSYDQQMLRLYGIPESEIAETLRRAEAGGIDLDTLEITTCMRGGEIEIVTRYEPPATATYEALVALVRERHADTLYSDDGSSVDVQVADLLRARGWHIATAESCTGGLIAARLTNLAGSSDYVTGGLVVYANEAKTALAGVPPELIEAHGAVSPEVAHALALGAVRALGADIGIGVTGIAGPGGGTEEKPVGTVCCAVATREGGVAASRRLVIPGARTDVRDRATVAGLHLIRSVLRDEQPPSEPLG